MSKVMQNEDDDFKRYQSDDQYSGGSSDKSSS